MEKQEPKKAGVFLTNVADGDTIVIDGVQIIIADSRRNRVKLAIKAGSKKIEIIKNHKE